VVKWSVSSFHTEFPANHLNPLEDFQTGHKGQPVPHSLSPRRLTLKAPVHPRPGLFFGLALPQKEC